MAQAAVAKYSSSQADRRSNSACEPDYIRSIPGSSRFVATAACHHGQAYGSLVVLDPTAPDDEMMGPVKRLTPKVQFPESDGGRQVYATAWPLSEEFYLCVYDGLLPWPEGTRIKALRIIQVLPKTTPSANRPRIGYGDQKGARAVLGTVPVEEDGSAYLPFTGMEPPGPARVPSRASLAPGHPDCTRS